MLPGVPPTGRHITVPLVAIVRFAVDPTDEKWMLWWMGKGADLIYISIKQGQEDVWGVGLCEQLS